MKQRPAPDAHRQRKQVRYDSPALSRKRRSDTLKVLINAVLAEVPYWPAYVREADLPGPRPRFEWLLLPIRLYLNATVPSDQYGTATTKTRSGGSSLFKGLSGLPGSGNQTDVEERGEFG